MAFDAEQYPYSPVPYNGPDDNDPLDRWLQVFNDQAAKLVAEGKDPDKVQVALQKKQAAITAAYNYYGPDIFKPKPTGSDLDVARNAYNLPTYTPQEKDSPLAYDRPAPKDFSNVESGTILDKNGVASPTFGDIISEGTDTANQAYKQLADVGGGLTNFAMAGPIAGGITGLGELADTGDFDKAADMANKVSAKLTYEPKTEGGKKVLEGINKPFELYNDAGDWIGDKWYDLTGSPSVGAITSSVFKIAPFLLGGGKLTKEPKFVKGEKLGGAIPETPVPDPTKIDFGRQQDLFDSPEANADVGSRDMFSGTMENAGDVEGRRQAAALATSDKELPQRTPEEDIANEKEYGFQQMEKQPLPDLGNGEPPAQADLWNFGAGPIVAEKLAQQRMMTEGQPNAAMAVGFQDAQLARGVDQQGASIFPRTSGAPDNVPGTPPVRRNFPLNGVDQAELPLQGGQADLFPMEQGNQPKLTDQQLIEKAQGTKDQTGVDDQGKTRTIKGQQGSILTDPEELARYRQLTQPKTDTLFSATEGLNRANGGRVAGTVYNALDKGELTGQHVVDAIADNHENIYGKSTPENEAREFVNELRKKGERFGGLDTPIVMIDPAAHADVLARVPGWQKHPGFYDETTNKIYIRNEADLRPRVLVHEVAHAISLKAIQKGVDGELVGAPRQAFATLNNIFDAVAARPDTSYGLKDLHEFTSELYSNPEFRTYLKTLDLDAVRQAKLGMPRTTWGKISNMYQAAVKGLSKLLGYSPKAENAFDVMLAAHENFMGSFSDKEAGAIRAENARGTQGQAVFGDVDNTFNARRKWEMIAERNKVAKERRLNEGEVFERYDKAAFDKRSKEAGGHKFDVGDRVVLPNGENATVFDRAMFSKKDSSAESRGYELVSDKNESYVYGEDELKKSNVHNISHKFASEEPIYERGLKPKEALRSIEDQRRGTELQGGILGLNNVNALNAARKVENAPNQAITDYYEEKNPAALDAYPKTKAAIDADKTRNAGFSQALAQVSRGMVNQSAKIANMANTFAANAGKYLMDVYRGSPYAKEAYDTAAKAEKALAQGKQLDAKQQTALAAIQGVRQFVTEHLVPGGDMAAKKLDTLHEMGDALGIDTRSMQDKSQIVDALNKAKPEGEKLNTLIDRLVREIGGFEDEKSSLGRWSRGSRYGDIFTEKGYVPEQLRPYLGRVDDISVRIMNTAAKQAAGLADLVSQDRTRKALDGRGLWANKVDAPAGAVELKGENLGSLQGMYADPKVADIIKGHLAIQDNLEASISALTSPNSSTAIGAGAAKVARAWSDYLVKPLKIFRLSTDAANHVMYFMGSFSKLATNGFNFGLPTMWRGIRETLREFGAVNTHPDYLELARNGLIDYHTQAALRGQIRRANFTGEFDGDPIAQALREKNPNTAVHKFVGILGAADHWSTKSNYFNRKEQLQEFYDRQGIEKTPREIEREAADQTKQTNTTPERGLLLGRAIENSGLSISVPYVIELHRNVFNSGLLGFEDMQRGAKANDPKMFGIGAKRVLGTLAAVYGGNAVFQAMGGLGASLLGVKSTPVAESDERTPYLQDEGSRFRAGQASELTNESTKDSKFNYMWDPGGAWDQFYAVSQPLAILTDMAQHVGDPNYDMHKQLGRVLDNYTAIIGSNPVLRNVMKTVKGDTPAMAYRNPDNYAERKEKLVNSFGGGIISEQNADRILNLSELGTPSFIKKMDLGADADWRMKTLIQLGYGVSQMPKDAGLSGPESNRYKATVSEARLPLEKMLKDDSNYSDAAIESQYVKSLKQANDSLQKLRDAIGYAKGNKLDEGDIYHSLSIKTDQDTAGSMGDISPAQVLFRDLSSTFEKQLELADEDKQDSKQERFMKKMEKMYDLTDKYMDLTPQQIKDL